MTGPGDEIAAAAAGRGQVRVSSADREQVVEMVKAAFMQGQLDGDQFDARIGHALAARTYADLAAVAGGVVLYQIRRYADQAGASPPL